MKKTTGTLAALVAAALTTGCIEQSRQINATVLDLYCDEGTLVQDGNNNYYSITNDQNLDNQIRGVVTWESFGRPPTTMCDFDPSIEYDWKRIPKVELENY